MELPTDSAERDVEHRSEVTRTISYPPFIVRLINWLVGPGVSVVPGVAMLVVGLYRIGFVGLSDDEHCTWWAVHLSWANFLQLLRHVDAVLFPYYLFLRAWTALLGDSEVSLRLPSAFAMAIAAGLVTQIGKKLGNASTGLLAGLCFVTVPSFVAYAQDARPYALAVATTLGATLMFLCAVERPNSRGRWFAYSGAVALIGATHLVSLSVLAGHLAKLIERRRRFPWCALTEKVWWRWGLAVTLGLLIIGPIVYLSVIQSGQLRPIELTVQQVWNLKATLPKNATVGWLLLGAAALGVLRRRPAFGMLLVWALLPVVLLFVSYEILHIFRPRYLLFTLPAWLLLAALGVTSLPVRSRFRWVIPVGFFVALVVGGQSSFVTMHEGTVAQRAPYRAMAAVLERRAQSDDAIVYGREPKARYHDRVGIAYAMRELPPLRDVFVTETAESRGNYKAKECKLAQNCLPDSVERLWLLTVPDAASTFGTLELEKRAYITSHFDINRSWRLGRKLLMLLTKRHALDGSSSEGDVDEGGELDSVADDGIRESDAE